MSIREQLETMTSLRAVSYLQPWASLLLGPKPVENRKWRLPDQYIGVPLAVHASNRYVADEFAQASVLAYRAGCDMDQIGPLFGQAKQTMGKIIGVILYSRNVTKHDSPFFFGPFGWVKAEVITLPRPLPCRGMLGVWEVPAAMVDEIRQQVSEVQHG